ncbi:MAG: hypothetical protein SFY66_12525 [Oculatellaceae cyanobacterium bins.114]|nr:hypothetical protein [Oculatellaceae cyanobacterium bins.114]
MAVLDHGQEIGNSLSQNQSFGDISSDSSHSNSSSHTSQGASIQESEVDAALGNAFAGDKDSAGDRGTNSISQTSEELHLSPDKLDAPKTLDPAEVQQENNLKERLGENGDLLDGGGGTNTVIGAGGSDIIRGDTAGAFNTITTGTGEDLIILGEEATNRVFDFNSTQDKFGLNGLSVENIIFGQGTNPDNGGLDQPLDSDNNTVILDKTTEHLLAALTFVNAGDISEQNFTTVDPKELDNLGSELIAASNQAASTTA